MLLRPALLLLLLLGPPARAQFVVPEGSDFHNGSTLPLESSGAASALLLRLEQAVANSDPDEVAHLLRSLRARPGPDLVPLGPRTHVPALDKAARRIAFDGEPSVRARVAQDEEAAIDRALRFRDLGVLLDHATRGRALPSAERAAWHAARLLFEEGRWWEAAALAGRIPALPGAAELRAASQARLPAPPPAPRAGLWDLFGVLSRPLDPTEGIGLPLVVDGRPGELLLLDSVIFTGLSFDEATFTRTFPDVFWQVEALAAERFVVSPPAPRRHALARSGDRLLFPFNVSLERGYRSPRAARDARLLAIDLGATPALAWSAVPESRAGSSAFGPAGVEGDRVFLQLFRTGADTEVSLVAFDLADGRLRFETPLVRGTHVRRYANRQALLDEEELDKRECEGTVAVRDGIVYACTGFGVVAAVDGLTGAIRHTFRYDRLFPLERGLYHPAYLFDTGGWDHEPVRLFGERLVVAPFDSRYLYMLALEPGPGGHLILDDPIERLDRVDVAALLPDPAGRPSPAVLATRLRDNSSSLVLLGPDGHVLASGPPLPSGELQRGRPVVAGSLVLLPTDKGIRTFDILDVTRPPGLLPLPPDLPPARAVYVVQEGLVALCPDEQAERLHFVLWRRER